MKKLFKSGIPKSGELNISSSEPSPNCDHIRCIRKNANMLGKISLVGTLKYFIMSKNDKIKSVKKTYKDARNIKFR